MKWYGHIFLFITFGQNLFARHSERGKKEYKADRKRGGKTTLRSGQAWSSRSLRRDWRTEKTKNTPKNIMGSIVNGNDNKLFKNIRSAVNSVDPTRYKFCGQNRRQQTISQHEVCILFKNRNACFFLFYFGQQTLYGTVLQHDNARPHAVCHTTQFLVNNNVQILPWPSTSPNLYPNKHT